MNAPLYNNLKKYKKENTSFHMPGHKFGGRFNLDKLNLMALDNTEVTGLDNLYNPSGIIQQAQTLMAQAYGSNETIFLTNGSTSGIIASILAVCSPGDSLIVARNCHHSVWNGLILGGINPIYINTRYISKYNLVGQIDPKDLEKTFKSNPHAKGIIIVSPTYEGIVSNIEDISNITNKYDKVLIVDEAHGAHFAWNKKLPDSALSRGADIVIQSMHKNMPALGQSALLHLNSKRVSKDTIIQRLQMVQTSSPSYMMMATMDYIRAKMEDSSVIWDDYIDQIQRLRKSLKQLQVLQLVSKTDEMYDLDMTKIVISTMHSNLTGTQLSDILRSKYNIQVELDSLHHIIALSTVSDTNQDLRKLEESLIKIDKNLQKVNIRKSYNIYTSNTKSYNPRKVYFSNKEMINLNNAVGKVSARTIMIYPPGIPLICIGELFNQEIINTIFKNINSIIGITNKDKDIFVSISSEIPNKE